MTEDDIDRLVEAVNDVIDEHTDHLGADEALDALETVHMAVGVIIAGLRDDLRDA